MLRKLAAYVQEESASDLALLLSSDFDAASTNRTRYPLTKPSILRIVAGLSGARGCEVRYAKVMEDQTLGEFHVPVFCSSSRRIAIAGLVPGAQYLYQARTLGGTTTYSDWSEPLVHRAA